MGKNITTILLVIIFLISCFEKKKKSFYDFSMQSFDVHRIPLINPYQVISATCCDGWNFSWSSSLGKTFNTGTSIDSVNVQGEIISFHCTSSLCNWLVLNCKDSTSQLFIEHQKYKVHMNKIGVDAKLFNATDIYYQWKEKNALPWRKGGVPNGNGSD